MDDVINISGHRLGTAEIEDAMVGHSKLYLKCSSITYLLAYLKIYKIPFIRAV